MNLDPTTLEVNPQAIAAWIPAAPDLPSLPGTPIIEISLPEYAAAGLGKAFCRARGFHGSSGSGLVGMFARSMCADSSRLIVVTAEMEPAVLGGNHDEIQTRAAPQVVRHLYDLGFPVELVSLGASRAHLFGTVEELTNFVRLYHRRSSWLEAHPLDVAIANLESQQGADLVFDGLRLFCEGV